MYRRYLLHSFCSLGGRIFDVLRLIYDHIWKDLLFVQIQITFQKIIGSDQYICFGRMFYDFFSLPAVSNRRFYCQVRRKPGDFALPVIDQGGRTDDQRALLLHFQQCDDLQCLAKPHIICQNAAEAPLRQHSQPAESVLLIFSQLRVQFPGDLKITVLIAVHIADELFEFRASSGIHFAGMCFQGFRYIGSPVFWSLEAAFPKLFLVKGKSLGEFGYQGKAIVFQADKITVFQTVILFPSAVALEDVFHFSRIHVLHPDIQIQQISGQTNAHIDLRRGENAHSTDLIIYKKRCQFTDFMESHVQKLIHFLF